MTTPERFERELPDILADLYPVSAPDYRHDLVQRIAATRQRPARAFPERWIPMRAIELGRAVRPVPWRTIGVVALLLVAIAAVAIIAGSTQRKLPPPFGPAGNGQLAIGEAGDIFLVDSRTGTKTLAIGGSDVDSNPTFSRDGTQIAFFRVRSGVRGLWVADDRGALARELSTAGVFDFSQIEWSPDAKSILLSAMDDDRQIGVIVPTDGGAAHALDTDMSVESPVWLPSGDVLFRGGAATGFGVFVMNPDGSDARPIVPATGAPQWDALYVSASPDGTQIAYQWRETPNGKMRIYVVAAVGGLARAITSVESVNPVWSPDGKWIAFFSDDGHYAVRADGTAPEQRLTTLRGDVRWTPDGSRLLFRPDGQAQQLLLDPLGGPEERTAWSSASFPDWQRLAPTP